MGHNFISPLFDSPKRQQLCPLGLVFMTFRDAIGVQQAAPTAFPGTLTTKSRTYEGGCREAVRGFAEVGTGPIGLWRNGQVRGLLCTPQ